MIFSSPSKTFLCGEYGVLVGGSALVITHEPRFSLEVSHAKNFVKNSLEWLHPDSPAGKLFEKHKTLLEDFDFQFIDPHEGRGGFGASGAQFVTLFEFIRDLKNEPAQLFPGVLLKEFKALDSSNSSGCDVLAQWSGGIALVNPQFPQDLSRYNWPFESLEAFIIPTGIKVPTHDHLKSLEKKNLSALKDLAQDAIESFLEKNEKSFLSHLQSFSGEMKSQDLLASHSNKMTEELRECPGYRLAKGCGAMGSDTVLLLIDRDLSSQARVFLRAKQMNWLESSFESDNSLGVKLESSSW